MIDMNSGTPSTRYCFWWKEGNKVRYTYGDEEDELLAIGLRPVRVPRRSNDVGPCSMSSPRTRNRESWRKRFLSTRCLRALRRASLSISTRNTATESGCGKPECLPKNSLSGGAAGTVNPHFMDPSKTLPGELRQVWGVSPREVVVEIGPVEGGGHIYVQNPSGWSAHLHMDDDSFLRLPGGKTLHHKGFKDERYEESDPRRGGNRGYSAFVGHPVGVHTQHTHWRKQWLLKP